MPYKGSELVAFKWDKSETMDDHYYAMIARPNAWSYYDNYSFKIITSNKMGYFQVSFTPTLNVYLEKKLVFERSITREYHFEIGRLENIKQYIFDSGKAAHEEFLRTFDQHEEYTAMAAFAPKFDENLWREHLDLHLRSSFFGNLGNPLESQDQL